jgi:hypothetical protein
MGIRNVFVLIGALFVVLVTAGCGASAAVTKTPPAGSHAKATATPVPTALALYASASKSTLDSSVNMVSQLLSQMKSSDLSSVGVNCSSRGPDLANLYSAFQGTSGPSSAISAYKPASVGYKYSLSAIDECGMAADTSSKSQMKVAYHDLSYGLSKLQKASVSLSTWASTKHP